MLLFILFVIFAGTFFTVSVAIGAGALWPRPDPDSGTAEAPDASLIPIEIPLLLRQNPESTISLWRQLLARFDFPRILKLRLDEAGLAWSVGRITLMMLLMGSVCAAILLAMDWAPLAGVPLGFAAAVFLPYAYILSRRKKRFAKIEVQFPDALDSLSRALRAGQTFSAGMQLMAAESPEPLVREVRKTCSEWQLGLAWNESLENLAQRLPLLEIRLFVAAVALQGRFGGKLNEILEELAKTIRDSITLRGDVRAISAQGRTTGAVLTILPIGIAMVMLVTEPMYISLLFRHPYGKYLLMGAGACLVLGHFAIQHIVDIA